MVFLYAWYLKTRNNVNENSNYYDGTLWCEPREDGDMAAGFMKEYRNTGNGYYYLLINDNTMIGYDID